MARPKKTTPVVPKDLKVYKEVKQQLSVFFGLAIVKVLN